MPFEDLGNWAELVGLKLPIGGKTYILPPIGAKLGLRIVALFELGADLARGRAPGAVNQELLSDEDEENLFKQVLGPVYDEMLEDNVPWPALKHAAMTAMMDVVYDRERAENFWLRLGKTTPAKKPAKKPADRLPRKATASKTSTASTGTSTRRRAPAKKAAAPRGPRSSPSGT
ncbi:hypothetical protein [Kribbella sp. NPDC051718]|uniref:DUF7426 family protein n=1 Tax=Kribbella sp. NPDC051718 TaxID=3155168 RepID=UPI0034134C6F